MRIVLFFISSILCAALIIILNTTLLLPAPLGKLLSPQQGVWQNAEPYDADYSSELHFSQLKKQVEVYFDDRLVPHIFAKDDEDAYFVQGYLHAKFRLWQMEFQTHAAAGRLSEIVGNVALDFDKNQRRLGMVFAAERSLKEFEKDPKVIAALNSYTTGINTFIETLTTSSLPLEYKLLGYRPEKWTNLKTALFLKYMALDLAGREDDFEMTYARSVFTSADFNKIYPIVMDSLDPIIPKRTKFDPPPVPLKIPANADSIYYHFKDADTLAPLQPDPSNGSNNWAVGPGKTENGAPILCNDPHLGLNLPSLWYEVQIQTPEYNVYGVSFPGAPSVIIGFNDSIAWGVTNGGRDVRDYYEIRFRDSSRKEYWFDSSWHETQFRIEQIRIKDRPVVYDTVAYTVLGPVMYDQSYTGGRATGHRSFAVRWKAHDPSNEFKTFFELNRAKNYEDYLKAISNFHTPGQNFAYASKKGDIAIWAQGQFPAKWYRQGDFVMPGEDSTYLWQYMIPEEQNPHIFNPESGFVSSANQLPADTSYPYYLGGDYPPYRGWEINKQLSEMQNITPQDMMKLQTDNYNVFGEMATPLLLQNIQLDKLDAREKKYYDLLQSWNYRNDTASRGATVFVLTWDSLEVQVWSDEFAPNLANFPWPYESTLLDNMRKYPDFHFYDDITTPEKETLSDIVTRAFKKASHALRDLQNSGKLEWARYKDTKIQHLTRLDALSRLHLPIGGGEHVINAAKHQHGPSWRMIVSLTRETEAYGVYPGGQSGNPGSRFYDSFVDYWALGKYYPLWVMKQNESTDKRILGKMICNPVISN